MPQRRATVTFPVGLHARPAMMFAQLAAAQRATVTIARPDGRPVPARNIVAVIALDVRCGEEVILSAEGRDAEQALDQLAALLAGHRAAPPA